MTENELVENEWPTHQSAILFGTGSKRHKQGQMPTSSFYWCVKWQWFLVWQMLRAPFKKEYFLLRRPLVQTPLKLGCVVLHFVASGLVLSHFTFLACCDEPLFMFPTSEWLRFLCRLVLRTTCNGSAQGLTQHEKWPDYDFLYGKTRLVREELLAYATPKRKVS